MNREETLQWIEDILDALDQFEVMDMIQEAIQNDATTPEFFATLDAETERYKAEGNQKTADLLHDIARAIATVRQNRKENL